MPAWALNNHETTGAWSGPRRAATVVDNAVSAVRLLTKCHRTMGDNLDKVEK